MSRLKEASGQPGIQCNDPVPIAHYDVVIIGGGFGGCYSLHKFRQAGFSCHVFEAGSGLGGVWHWNSYPGARVDSEIPYYQFSIPEVFKDWTWSQRFPGHAELKAYFQHVDKKLNLSKDVDYNSIVIGADFDSSINRWTVETQNGHKVTCQWLVPATGSSHKRYEPHFTNMESFQGQIIHSASWPTSNIDFEGKKVAVIGAGASGIQCVSEISKQAAKLTNYIRNPNIALPMQQRQITDLEQRINKANYLGLFRLAKESAAGIAGDPCTSLSTDHTPKQREAMWEELYARGGFNFQAANYTDFLVDEKANRLLYDFWCKKTRERVKDPVKADIVAPIEPPYPFATKRSSLEHDYYECISRDNVELVDLKKSPIAELTSRGIRTEDGDEREFDVIVLATGYDNMTGSLTSMGLRGADGVDLKKKWSQGVSTYLGVLTSSCPNMFMIFGPQAPTAFTNAPVFIEMQVDFVVELVKRLRDENVRRIEVKKEAEDDWYKTVQAISNATVFTKATSSWYLGSNIPGKKREQLNYIGGIKGYMDACADGTKDWSKFDVDVAPKMQTPMVAKVETPTVTEVEMAVVT